MKRALLAVLLVSMIGASAYALTRASANGCCCDFSNGKIVCTIT